VLGDDDSGGPGWVVCATAPSVVREQADAAPSATATAATVAATLRTCVLIPATLCG
jgi:hypothetical protein